MKLDLQALAGLFGVTGVRSGATPARHPGVRLEHREDWLRALASAAGLDRPRPGPAPFGDGVDGAEVDDAEHDEVASGPWNGPVPEHGAAPESPLPQAQPGSEAAGPVPRTQGFPSPTTGEVAVAVTLADGEAPIASTSGLEAHREIGVTVRTGGGASDMLPLPETGDGTRLVRTAPSGDVAPAADDVVSFESALDVDSPRPAAGSPSPGTGDVRASGSAAAGPAERADGVSIGEDPPASLEPIEVDAAITADGDPEAGLDGPDRPVTEADDAPARDAMPHESAEETEAVESGVEDPPVTGAGEDDAPQTELTGNEAADDETVTARPPAADAARPAPREPAEPAEDLEVEVNRSADAPQPAPAADPVADGDGSVFAPAAPAAPERPIDAPEPREPAPPSFRRARGVRWMSTEEPEARRGRGGELRFAQGAPVEAELQEVADEVRAVRRRDHVPGVTLPETAAPRARERSALTRLEAFRRHAADSLTRIDPRLGGTPASAGLDLDVPERAPRLEPPAAPADTHRAGPALDGAEESGPVTPTPAAGARGTGPGPGNAGGDGATSDGGTSGTTSGTGATSGTNHAGGSARSPELVPVRHELLAQAILARARTVPRNGSVKLRFALEPQDLGQVRVRIESAGEHLRIEIAAATHAAVDTLHGGIARLVSQLHEAGFKDPDVNLLLDPGDTRDARAESGSASRDDGTQQRRGRRAERRPGSVEGAEAALYGFGSETGRLNLFA